MSIKTITVAALFALAAWIPSAHCLDDLETITIKCGGAQLRVEIAADTKTRDKGLMHRESLPPDTGMLFVYKEKRYGRLWMKNTLIPLSAAFIDEDGKILQIMHMKKTNSSRIYKSKEKIKYALEVPLGWFREKGIKPGDYCSIPDISAK